MMFEKKTTTASALFIVLMLGACVFMTRTTEAKVLDLQDGSYTTIEEFRNRPDRKTQRTAADDQLARRVSKALADSGGIRVDVENGTVTLQGKVNSAEERLELVKRVQGLEGVKAVRAELFAPGEYNEAEEIRTRSMQLGLDLF